jgi:hypothetical protein
LANVPGDWSHGTGADERWYRFYVQAIDRASNTQTYAMITSTYDVKPGSATILVPNASVVSALPTISGTATDSTFGTTALNTVEISVQRSSNGEWYRFSNQTWNPSGTNIWNTVDSYNSGNGEWYMTTTQVNLWENLVDYNIYVRAVDKAGNYQTSQVYPSTYTFSFQPPPSAVAITRPSTSRFYTENLADIVGTANAATIRVEVQIERLSDNKY